MKIAVLHQGVSGSGRAIVQNAWELKDALVGTLSALGWDPIPVYLDDGFAWLSELRAMDPQLVLNAADLGFRYDMTLEPAIAATLDVAGFRFTGSDAYTNYVSSDKYTSKLAVAAEGVPVARCWREADALDADLPFPVLVKMRYGHNSYGLDDTSVVPTRAALISKLTGRPADAPELVVEEYIDGPEATGGFLGQGPRDLLPVFTIAFGAAFDGRPRILNSATKWDPASADYQQSASVPADFPPDLVAQIHRSTDRTAVALGIRDYGRADFRVAPDADGRLTAYLIDANANPDLHPGAGLARMATAAGLGYPEMLQRIVAAALARPPRRPAKEPESPTDRPSDLRPIGPVEADAWPPSSKIAVRSAGARGRGVFARAELAEGELVEEAVVIPISAAEAAGARHGGGVLEEYLFAWDEGDEQRAFAVGTGFAPMFNHSPTPNVTLRRDLPAKILRFVALRPIRAGEELCFDYDCPLWFDPS